MQMGGSREDELPSELEQELRNQLTNLRERVSDYVQQQFLLHGDVSGEQLREQVFKSMNMAQIDRSYLHEVHSLVRKMAKKLANLHSRRKKNFKKGKLDIRKTIRDNWVNQGILFDLSWAYKKVDRPKIYVICDVSGSVGAYARFMLMFLFSLTEVVSKLRAFVFSSNLGEVTNDFKDAQLDEAIEKALQKHGGGSTDYGQALTDFVSLCLDEIDKKTTVVILGDARNNFGPEKAHLMKSINERANSTSANSNLSLRDPFLLFLWLWLCLCLCKLPAFTGIRSGLSLSATSEDVSLSFVIELVSSIAFSKLDSMCCVLSLSGETTGT